MKEEGKGDNEQALTGCSSASFSIRLSKSTAVSIEHILIGQILYWQI